MTGNEIIYIIKEVLNGNRIVSYDRFRKIIGMFFSKYLKDVFNNNAKFIISNKLGQDEY